MNEPKETTDPPDLKLVKEAASALFAHFDAVQILATRSDGEVGTVRIAYGLGNTYARYGHARTWVEQYDEESRQQVRDRLANDENTET